MNKKNIFDMLENAEDDSMDILTENCPDVSDEQLEKLLAESERRYLMKKKEIEEKNTNTDIEKPEYNEDSVSGVERIKSRPAWLRPLAIAASFVLVAGTAAGSIALLNKGKADRPDKSSAAASTEAATIDHEDVDQDYIIDLCSHVTDHYDKLFIKGVFEVDVNFLENPSHVRLEKTRRYDNLKKTSDETIKATSTFDNEPDSNSVITAVSYYYNDRIVDVNPDEKNYTITDASAYPMSFYKTETSNALACIDAHTNESILRYHMEEWSITGWDTVCGRECAVITTKSDSVESVDYIDIETGVILKFSSDSEREHIDYEVSDVQYNDAAGDVVTPSEFKKYIADNGFVLDSSYILKGDGTEELADQPFDLSFLDVDSGASDEITIEWLIAHCKEAAESTSRLYREYDTKFSHCIDAYDREKGIYYCKRAAKEDKTTFSPIGATVEIHNSSDDDTLEYKYNGRTLVMFTNDTGELRVNEDNETSLSVFNAYFSTNEPEYYTVKGEEEYLGKNCAVVIYAPPPSKAKNEDYHEVEQWIDLETGTVLRSGIIQEDGSVNYRTETTTFLVGADAENKILTPQDIKQLIADKGYTVADGLSLDFLDSAPEQTTAQPATEAETEDVSQEKTFAEAETESAQPATQAPAEIDKDYILDLVSNRKNNINRVYAKVNQTQAERDESESIHPIYDADVTIQYDKNKNCFCEYVNDETGTHCPEVDTIIYKGKWLVIDKSMKYHIITEFPSDYSTVRTRDIFEGSWITKSLDSVLSQNDKWSINGRENLHDRDCAVIEYNEYDYDLGNPQKCIMYIDIQTGIAIKTHITYYRDRTHKEIAGTSTQEITELKLNDDAPVLKPSDFKKYIKDNGFEPEDEESKDLSFLDN